MNKGRRRCRLVGAAGAQPQPLGALLGTKAETQNASRRSLVGRANLRERNAADDKDGDLVF